MAQIQLRIKRLESESKTIAAQHSIDHRDVATGLLCTAAAPDKLHCWQWFLVCVHCMAFINPSISVAQICQYRGSFS